MLKIKYLIIAAAVFASSLSFGDRIKDLTDVAGVRSKQVVGFTFVYDQYHLLGKLLLAL